MIVVRACRGVTTEFLYLLVFKILSTGRGGVSTIVNMLCMNNQMSNIGSGEPLVPSLIGMQFFIKYPIKNPVCMSNRFVVAHSVPRYFVADRGHYPKFFIFILFLILIFSRLNFFRHFFLYFSNKFYFVLISAGQKMIFSKTSAEGSPC